MPRRRLAFDGSSSPTGQPTQPKLRHIVKPISFDIDVAMAMDDAQSEMEFADTFDSCHVTQGTNIMSTDEESCDSGIDSPTSNEEDLIDENIRIDTVKLNLAKKNLFQPSPMDANSASVDDLKCVVEKMEREEDLVGDGTRPHNLPIILGRHKDLKSVTPRTVSDLVAGGYNDVISGYQIIDCRYPYEFEGGHIEGAINLHTEAQIEEYLTSCQERQFGPGVLVFHCEFSSERGPKMLRCLRRLDRNMNAERYPALYFPEVYLMDGGYKAFFEHFQDKCQPRSYLPMVHQSYSKQLRHFRAKSKSWTAGEKQSMRRKFDLSPLKCEF